jgi:hypothetical protein
VDKEMRNNEYGKEWDYCGNIKIGGFKDGLMREGDMYELQQDGTHTLFHVKYDDDMK